MVGVAAPHGVYNVVGHNVWEVCISRCYVVY